MGGRPRSILTSTYSPCRGDESRAALAVSSAAGRLGSRAADGEGEATVEVRAARRGASMFSLRRGEGERDCPAAGSADPRRRLRRLDVHGVRQGNETALRGPELRPQVAARGGHPPEAGGSVRRKGRFAG